MKRLGTMVESDAVNAWFQTVAKVGLIGNLKKFQQFFQQKTLFLKLEYQQGYDGRVPNLVCCVG